jgi:hypothetical protein
MLSDKLRPLRKIGMEPSRGRPVSESLRPPRFQLPSDIFGVLTVLTAGSVMASLYFVREIIVPITLAIPLSFRLGQWYAGSADGISAKWQ